MMKQVRFDEAVPCQVINATSYSYLPSQKNVKKCWYTQEDYDHFAFDRSYCTFILRKVGKDKLLDSLLPYDDSALIDVMAMRSKLHEWTDIGVCRGLEVRINRSHRYQRLEEQRKAIYAVLKLQARLRVETKCENYHEIIRESYERYSESAKIFAREMACADENCILELEMKEPVIMKKGSILRRLLRW
jgi:hypothetical protein